MSDKKPLIVFSGGLDSTYLLYDKILDGDVYTVYISGDQSKDKAHMERLRRQEIFKYLEKMSARRGGGKVIEDLEVSINAVVKESKSGLERCKYEKSGWAFKQVHSWVHGVLSVVDPSKHSSIMMGYVSGDQMLYHLQDLEALWGLMSKISFMKTVPIEFPIKFAMKRDLLRALPDELKELIWYCENPQYLPDACGYCTPCITHKAAKHNNTED